MRAAALGMVLLCGIAQGAEPKTVTNTTGMELIEIPAGKFTMGEDGGAVAVTLTKPFWLGKTEVTQGQWQQVMGTAPWKGQQWVQADQDCPATFVSFFDAVEFCEKLTDLERKAGKLKANEEYRLPTEAEWEYACRAGTTTAFSFGDESKLNSHAWWGGLDLEALSNGETHTGPGNAAREQYAHKVGLKKPNPWGLYDMHGNVAEWCSDWYGKKLSGGTDPIAPEEVSRRMIRGGGWWSDPDNCRSANRGSSWRDLPGLRRSVPLSYFIPSNRLSFLGFRVARSQSETVVERPAQLEENSLVENSIDIELVRIRKGKFLMGEGGGAVNVTLAKLFWLGKYEVTQGQWRQVMGTEPWKGQAHVKADKDCPASYVDWDDATEFCQKLTDTDHKNGKLPAGESYRLPTTAEWEYACRAGTKTTWSFGDDEKQLDRHVWFKATATSADGTAGYAYKVGLRTPNPWGLHDMHGNVMEWCSDWYSENLSGGADPVGPEEGSGRVVRGGGWGDDPDSCRSAYRISIDPSYRDSDLGFRVARSQSETVAERRQQGAQAEPAPQVAAAERPVQLEENSIGMELVELPAGKCTMGGGGGVNVTLTKPFLLGTTEVTQGQFKKVMGKEPWVGPSGVQIGEDNAAWGVAWNDATAFCQKLTGLERKAGKLKANEEYRLPTEAEWEYACRAGTRTAFSFGNDESQLGEYAWFKGNTAGEQYAHAVGMKKPNPWGLHDMHGNVVEWCSDWYGEKLSGGTDPVGPEGGSRRVLRGGSWYHDPDGCRSTQRFSSVPSDDAEILGFRVARSRRQ